ncbi:exopolygalacturonase clone GBGE184-like [Cucurbita pepo subsp. pepo]|uniref:exopolygalacturonase clone GBGE184-like n=1 Tax=Cucurbita pepo subsp. pepo TaxID=3664 RepID=UPI000C9D4238|nr:exopolygalacturonase clone GBGE184-like [Cucurbita pepo subsp. pepo]
MISILDQYKFCTAPSPGTSSTPTAPSQGTPSAPATPSTASTPATPGTKVFDITTYGAKPDGKKINTQAFMKAWVEACHSGGPAKVVFPPGKFLTGPLVYAGPCDAPMTVEIQGTVLATTDITEYSSPVWILFESITGLNLIGNGTFDGQGQETWMYNDCRDNPSCIMPPASLKFNKVTNGLMEGISSLNSKGFHVFLVLSHHLRVNNLNIIAPDHSPNTDGIHISSITSSIIGTGDDCVSIGHGSGNVTVSNIKCGPGHGISVGSLGKYKDEKDVSGIFVSNCTLKNTTFGVRIKTWADSPPSQATGIHFQDIVLDSVKNPIIIDQFYGSKKNKKPSKVKISDVSYKNIQGTTISVVPVSLQCSSAVPCDGITLEDIDLAFIGSDRKKALVGNSCLNAKFKATGKQNPPACA